MPGTALRCRVCETQYDLDPIGVCSRCFGPLDPVYDRDEQRRTVTREAIEAGPQSIWRYAPLLPVAPPEDVRLPVGWTPLVNVPRLADAVGVGELRLKLDTANPTHSFKDRVVAVACAKALESGATTLACSSTGNLANAVAARAAAAWAATAFARLPVDAHAIVWKPSSFARASATATTRSLNECVGLAVSSLRWSSPTPSASASRGADTSGV